ncbi:MAG: von Willebrand factor type A domain-containing protein [Candidatus Hatepunaea meridiana]|nr:von Willebrand factor type A domain-containing protein [Candidatus Hatepunaea meridiana]
MVIYTNKTQRFFKLHAMIVMICIVFATFACIQSTYAGTTGKLTGIVTDAQNKEPISHVNIVEVNKDWGGATDLVGQYLIINIPPGSYDIEVSALGYHSITITGVEIHADLTTPLDIALTGTEIKLDEVTVIAAKPLVEVSTSRSEVRFDSEGRFHVRGSLPRPEGVPSFIETGSKGSGRPYPPPPVAQEIPIITGGSRYPPPPYQYPRNTEQYEPITENVFLDVLQNPLSTFSIDVDAASYSNIRRFIDQGKFPPPNAVRIEEMINYFTYDYPQPEDEHPFSVIAEISDCSWSEANRLLHIGLQGRNIPLESLPPANLVFLLDVSGSMTGANKLPLLKKVFKLLVDQLREEDHISIVTYSSATQLVLPSTSGHNKQRILDAMNALRAGGSTAGGAGIQLAYKTAQESFIPEGNNRVILATDGDFNVGVSDDDELVKMIVEKRKAGIFLSILGFGMGNYKDAKMEKIADKGNGNYAYIDNIHEGRKVFVDQIGGTLLTIAKDVKIQIEFNPVKVKAYRLIGYENRILAKEDFRDDKKDAGEMGAGHSVTALYEIVPADAEYKIQNVDSLKYMEMVITPEALESREMLTLKLRYKPPESETSIPLVIPVDDHHIKFKKTSDNFRFSAAVAEFGMLLRGSSFKGNASYDEVLKIARKAKGDDKGGYRAEFVKLVETCKVLK